MVLVAVVVLSALAVPLFGGRLGALAEVRLRRVWAIFAALGLAVAMLLSPRVALLSTLGVITLLPFGTLPVKIDMSPRSAGAVHAATVQGLANSWVVLQTT